MSNRDFKRKVLTIAKKLQIFELDDVQMLIDKKSFEIEKILYMLTQNGSLEKQGNCYVYIPNLEKQEEAIIKTDKKDEDLLINTSKLSLRPKRPKEVYFRRITDIEGYENYFFASASTKAKIQKMMKVLREGHGLKGKNLEVIFKKYKISEKTYRRYRNDFLRNGFKNIPTAGPKNTPPEVYYFFKEFYLSYRRYSIEEARSLAIKKFQKLYSLKAINRKIDSGNALHRRVLREYSSQEVKKFRFANFSEFDIDTFIKH